MIPKLHKIAEHTSEILKYLLLVVLVLFAYSGQRHIYFQQDEWYIFGQALVASNTSFSNIFSVVGTYHFTPISNILYFVQFLLFRFNHAYYAATAVVLHGLVVALLFRTLRRISGNGTVSFLIAAVFATLHPHHEAVTWYATTLSTTMAAVFSILAYDTVFVGKKITLWTLSYTIVAILCKEDSLYLIVALPLLAYFRVGSYHISGIKRFIAVFVVFAAFRILLQLYSSANGMMPKGYGIFSHIDHLIENIPLFLVGPGYCFVSPDTLIRVLTPLFSIYVEYGLLHASDMSNFLIPASGALIHIIVIIISSICIRISKFRLADLIPYIVFIGSFFPYILLGRNVLVTESRYLYIPSVYLMFAASYYLSGCTSVICFRRRIIYSIVLFGFVVQNVYLLSTYFENERPLSELRRSIVTRIQSHLPIAKNRLVVYFENQPTVFKSGVGQMILVISANRNNTFYRFLKGYFLWGIGEEGYLSNDSASFGYYNSLNTLNIDKSMNLFAPEEIIHFSYNPITQSMDNDNNDLQTH